MADIVLLGDSVFDNAAYVAGGPDVVRQLRAILPSGWRATLNALDGAVIADVAGQLRKVASDATHVVISAGGNDALGQAHALDQMLGSMAEALDLLSGVRERFRAAYAAMLDDVLKRGVPTAVCTIYEPRFSDSAQRSSPPRLSRRSTMPSRARRSCAGVMIDLRVLCNEDRDFANPAEPSVHGGEKIARPSLPSSGRKRLVGRALSLGKGGHLPLLGMRGPRWARRVSKGRRTEVTK